MKIPKIIYSDKILNRLSWFMKIGGITLWPKIILREKYRDNKWYHLLNEKIIRHESIHIKQQGELLVLFFFPLYLIEWLIRIPLCFSFFRAYQNISFEREAKLNENDLNYLDNRKKYAFLKYIILKKSKRSNKNN